MNTNMTAEAHFTTNGSCSMKQDGVFRYMEIHDNDAGSELVLTHIYLKHVSFWEIIERSIQMS